MGTEIGSNGVAEIKGRRLHVMLPLWQVGTLLIGLLYVVYSVRETTQELSYEVKQLGRNVAQQTATFNSFKLLVDELKDRIVQLEADHRARVQ